jgi:hypothetical protein
MREDSSGFRCYLPSSFFISSKIIKTKISVISIIGSKTKFAALFVGLLCSLNLAHWKILR